VILKVVFAGKKPEAAAPLTAFDWNPKNLNLIGTSSVDTTCTIWDIGLFVENTTHHTPHHHSTSHNITHWTLLIFQNRISTNENTINSS
jgi:hypothetical protein